VQTTAVTLDVARVGDIVLSSQETAWLETLPPEQAHRAFLSVWSRKEAVAKCDGRGLQLPLAAVPSGFHVGPASPDTELIMTEGDGCSRFTVFDLDLISTHVGAVAVANRPTGVVFVDSAAVLDLISSL
jgi:4'-phosphopantetheinyl transferase